MDQEQFQKAYGKLIAKAWSDDDFKAKLLANPMAVFKENEVKVPEGIEVRMVENTKETIHFIFPPEPSDELLDGELNAVAGGLCGLDYVLQLGLEIGDALIGAR